MATIRVSSQLSRFLKGSSTIQFDHDEPAKIPTWIAESHPALAHAILTDDQQIQPYVRVVIDGRIVDDLEREPLLNSQSDIRLLSAVSGG